MTMDSLQLEALARYQALISALPDMLHLLDSEGRFLDTHVGSVALYCPIDQYLGKTVWEVFPPAFAEEVMRRIQVTLDTGVMQEWEYTLESLPGTRFEARLVRVDGKNVGKGQVFAIIRDITNTSMTQTKMQLEKMVAERTRQLQTSNEALQSFAYAASHDLREPLNKITAFGMRITERYSGQLDPKGLQYLEIMQTAARRMSRLIDDLLEFSRAGAESAPRVDVDLNRLLSEIISDLEITITEAQAKVELEKLPTVQGHPARLRQVFQNLLSNALKFRQPGRDPIIQVSGRVEKGNAIITVQDNGIGFEPQYAEKIFTVFTRLHTRFEYPGTGIGLALCRRILDQYGGTISAQGVPNEGAAFTLVLPLGLSAGHFCGR